MPGLTGPAGLPRGAVVNWSDRSREFAPSFSAVRPMLAGQKRKRERGKWELDREIFSHCVRCETKCSLDEREKRKCSTGKVLTVSAARPNARWTERGNREEKNGSLTGRFSHTASAVRPNARWTKEKT